MTRPPAIRPDELLAPEAYDRVRDAARRENMSARALRRVPVGPNATLSFESRQTVRYQIQEMIRAERIVDPAAVAQEIETYGELLPGPRELSATLMLEWEQPARDARLRELLGIDRHVHLRVERGGQAFDAQPRFDERQIDAEKVSAIQFVRFALAEPAVAALREGARLVAVIDHPAYAHRAVVPDETRDTLVRDLADAAERTGASGTAPAEPRSIAPAAKLVADPARARLAERLASVVDALRAARALAATLDESASVELLDTAVTQVERHAASLRATPGE